LTGQPAATYIHIQVHTQHVYTYTETPQLDSAPKNRGVVL
jgi:hypothetical protein